MKQSAERHCLLCGSTACRSVEQLSRMLALNENSKCAVQQCTQCKFMFLHPYLSSSELERLYSKSYFTGKSDYNETTIAPDISMDYESQFAAMRMRKFSDTLDLLIHHRPNAKTVLDVGAATGEFLALCKDRGMTPTGIELSAYASGRAKEKFGLEFHSSRLEDFRTDEKFDLIHLNHVLEHFADPRAVVQVLNRILSDDGLIYIEVPFQFNVIERTKQKLGLWKKQFDIFSVHHPIFFRPATLRKLFHEQQMNCTLIRVFQWTRYPTRGLADHLKRLCWLALSFAGQGIYIEAIFEKSGMR
jgi:2-polyprenyl-3-methyl-5-hydroxy-6-metoxy-1,4-benzoquinol methylase